MIRSGTNSFVELRTTEPNDINFSPSFGPSLLFERLFFRAMDGFSPYCQDMIFSRLSKHLHPVHGRLYVVGLNPIPDYVEGEANILCEITRLRDACILLAGEYRLIIGELS